MENFITSPGSPRYSYYAGMLGEGVEDVDFYEPGGFHPVLLGDILDGRFKVVNKLGYGISATVWLCRDLDLGKWRAVKIFAASHSDENCANLELPRANSPRELYNLATPLEHFWVVGPNGRHLCSLLPLLGPSLSQVAFASRKAPEFLKATCHQLVEAMHLVHSKGLCHGDVRPSNIMFQATDDLHYLTEEQMLQVLGGPHLRRVRQYVAKRNPNSGGTLWVPADEPDDEEDYDSEGDGGDDSGYDSEDGPEFDHEAELGPDYDLDEPPLNNPDSESISFFDDSPQCPDRCGCFLCDCHNPDCPSFDDSLPQRSQYLVSPAPLDLSKFVHWQYTTPWIALSDFDFCHAPDAETPINTRESSTTKNVSLEYAAPEVSLHLNGPRGHAADIWSLAATMFKIVCGLDPFDGLCGWRSMEEYLGPSPAGYAEAWGEVTRRPVSGMTEEEYREKAEKRREKWGTENMLEQMLLMKLKYKVEVEFEEDDYGWEEGPGADGEGKGRKEREYYFSREEIGHFADLLGKMLKWKPEDRVGLKEVMRHPWFEDCLR